MKENFTFMIFLLALKNYSPLQPAMSQLVKS